MQLWDFHRLIWFVSRVLMKSRKYGLILFVCFEGVGVVLVRQFLGETIVIDFFQQS